MARRRAPVFGSRKSGCPAITTEAWLNYAED
jgi:hypothetical protein